MLFFQSNHIVWELLLPLSWSQTHSSSGKFQGAARDADKVFLAAIDKFDAMMSRGNVYAPDGMRNSYSLYYNLMAFMCTFFIS